MPHSKSADPRPPAGSAPQPAAPPEVREGYVAVGVVLTSFGLRGDMKIQPLTDFPERFDPGKTLWLGGVARIIKRNRWHDRFVYVRLEGIRSPEEVAALRGSILEVPEDDRPELDEDQYFQSDIIGLSVRTTAGDDLGRVIEFQPTGANDVLVVRGPRGEVLVPMIADVVQRVDLNAGVIEIEPIEGLLPEPSAPKPPRVPPDRPGGWRTRPRAARQRRPH